MDPLTHGRGGGSKLRVPPVAPPTPHMAPCQRGLSNFYAGQAVYWDVKIFSEFDFFQNPSVALTGS